MTAKNTNVLRYINAGLSFFLALLFILPVMKLHIIDSTSESVIHLSLGQLLGAVQLFGDFAKIYETNPSLANPSVVLIANATRGFYLLIFFLILPLAGAALSLLSGTKKVSWLSGIPTLICTLCFFILYRKIESNVAALNIQLNGDYNMSPYQGMSQGLQITYELHLAFYGYLYILICLISIVLCIILFIKREKPEPLQVLVDSTTGRVIGTIPGTISDAQSGAQITQTDSTITPAPGATGTSLSNSTSASAGPTPPIPGNK